LPQSLGHGQFSSVVTFTGTLVVWSHSHGQFLDGHTAQIVTLVAVRSMMHIGVIELGTAR